jgi:hypothetical protein
VLANRERRLEVDQAWPSGPTQRMGQHRAEPRAFGSRMKDASQNTPCLALAVPADCQLSRLDDPARIPGECEAAVNEYTQARSKLNRDGGRQPS